MKRQHNCGRTIVWFGVITGGFLSMASACSAAEYVWTQKTDMPTARWGHGSAVVDGRIYVMGGAASQPNDALLWEVDVYDPFSDTWTRKADMLTPRFGLSPCVVNGRIYAIGGDGGRTVVEEYDPATDSWTQKSPMPVATSQMASVVLGDKIIVIGGWLWSMNYPYTTVQIYDPETDIWTMEDDVPFLRAAFSADVVDNRIYVVGGTYTPHPCSATATVYAYDIITDFNGDGLVDSKDMGAMVAHWGLNDPLYDIGPMPWGDGIVDLQDLKVLAGHMPEVCSPMMGAVDVPRDVTLSWTGSPLADTYDVYFGTVFEDANAADRDNPLGVLVSQGQDANTYDPGGLLEFGQAYYCRVDEVSAPSESTTYKGFVWGFTTEPMSYPFESVTATCNATSKDGEGPDNTVNGSGLNADDEHSTVAADMWLGAPAGAEPVYIRYEFDKVYKLHQMLVWNYNVQFELVLGFGLKDVTVEYSENGTDWVVLSDFELAQATATSAYTANTTVDLSGVIAKYVRLTVSSGWGMMGRYGLSEVRFFSIPTRAREPQPADGETGISPDTILTWRAGREAVAHDVYLSADRQAVVDGAALVDTVTESAYQPDTLDRGQTYYWKVNEINEAESISVWEGSVWKFTTAE